MQHSPRSALAGGIIVNVCPPPCGSGKTHAVIHHSAAKVAAGERVAIICPTRRLVAQTAAGLMAAGCENVTAITGDTAPDPVGAVLRHVRDEAKGPGVLLSPTPATNGCPTGTGPTAGTSSTTKPRRRRGPKP